MIPLTTHRTTVSPGRPSRPRWLIIGVLGLLAVTAGAGVYALARDQRSDPPTSAERATAGRAGDVTGFDLNATTHTFTKTADGGVEVIVANSPADGRTTSLVRSHLQEVASALGAGDYSGPATIHGANMPGLAELSAGAARVRLAYEQVRSGGRITYRSGDPALVAALHTWFDAQNAAHAMPGMGGGQ